MVPAVGLPPFSPPSPPAFFSETMPEMTENETPTKKQHRKKNRETHNAAVNYLDTAESPRSFTVGKQSNSGSRNL